jgi:hypothetical protein
MDEKVGLKHQYVNALLVMGGFATSIADLTLETESREPAVSSSYGNNGACVRPMVSGKPSIRFMF